MERQPHDHRGEIDIERKSPNLIIEIAGIALNLNWYNTYVQTYDNNYLHMLHFVHQPETGYGYEPPQRIFNRSQAAMLIAKNYPMRYDPEPSDEVAGIYLKYEQEKLGGQMERSDWENLA